MLDRFGREIRYMRISVTDRCDLRCVYCMPEEGVSPMGHDSVLRYEEIVRIVRAAASLGIKKLRLTGGEPLVRRDLHVLIRQLKAVEGIESVSLTTNGMLLAEQLPALLEAGLDGVNISLDAVDEDIFRRITRRGGVERVLAGIDAALSSDRLRVKLNCVPTRLNESQFSPMARRFLMDTPIDLRFIELMPIGLGGTLERLSESQVRAVLEEDLGPLLPLPEQEDPKCRLFGVEGFLGRIGFISSVSHRFCASCDRVRLMADGFLKTCLQYDEGLALRPLLAGSDEALIEAMRGAIRNKPAGHHFDSEQQQGDERRGMSQIGG